MTLESPEKIGASYESADASIDLWVQGAREQALSKLLSAFEENATCGLDWSWQ